MERENVYKSTLHTCILGFLVLGLNILTAAFIIEKNSCNSGIAKLMGPKSTFFTSIYFRILICILIVSFREICPRFVSELSTSEQGRTEFSHIVNYPHITFSSSFLHFPTSNPTVTHTVHTAGS